MAKISENYYVVKVTPEGLKSWRFVRPFESTDEGSLPITKFCEILEEAARDHSYITSQCVGDFFLTPKADDK